MSRALELAKEVDLVWQKGTWTERAIERFYALVRREALEEAAKAVRDAPAPFEYLAHNPDDDAVANTSTALARSMLAEYYVDAIRALAADRSTPSR
jgi:hypothetical protein